MEITENNDFINYLEDAVGHSAAMTAIEGLKEPASVSVRLNPLKIHSLQEAGLTACAGVPWNDYGYFLEKRPSFTLDPVFHAGGYYVQDSSAMFVGYAFRQAVQRFSGLGRALRVLDLCAAPGGKTTDLAASLREMCGDSFVLVANEVMKQRVNILCDNVAKWGEPNVIVTSADPKAFEVLQGFFDIIVADVPCSGEGMFRKDEDAQRQWSVDNVALCEARQRRIVADVWPALSDGGVFIYSTCTFNKHENDGNVKWIADNLGGKIIDLEPVFAGLFKTEYGISLLPGMVKGEGQYCASMMRTSGNSSFHFNSRDKFRTSVMPFNGLFETKMIFRERGGLVIAVPELIKSEISALEVLRPVMEGVAVGTVKGRDLVPHADLAMNIALAGQAFPRVEAALDKALAYLHKDAVVFPDAERGLLLVTYIGLPLGFVKNLGNRCNNLLPQERRIRMDI